MLFVISIISIIIGAVFLLFGAFAAIGGVGVIDGEPQTAMMIVGIVVAAIGVFALVMGYRTMKNRSKKKTADKPVPFPMSTEQMQEIEAGGLPVLYGTPLLLKSGEMVHYRTPCGLSVTRRELIGSTGGGAGASFRIAKGIYLHSGKSSSKRIYDDVTNTFKGELFITNARIVFLQSRAGFELPIVKLSAILPIEDGIRLQSGNKTYDMVLPFPEYPYTVIQTVFWNSR